MKIKKFLILPLVALICACSTSNNSLKIKFRHQQGTSDYNDYCYYTDDVFEQDATVYNPKLASMSISFAMASFASMSIGDYGKKSYNAKDFLEKAGFTGFEANDFYKIRPGTDTIGLVAANKKIGDYTLVALGVRGAAYFSEWASNFTLGPEENNYHKGFKEAADYYISFAKTYIKSQKITGNIKIWTSGYSRGGATCNIAAGLINQISESDSKIFGENTSFSKNNFFVYTFEAPRGAPYTKDEKGKLTVKSEKYNNIFNIVNFNDVVPLIAPKELGFTRFGKDIYLPDSVLNLNYESHLDKMQRLYYKIDNHEVLGNYKISDFSYRVMKGFGTDENINSHNMTQGLFLKEFVSDLAEIGVASLAKQDDQTPLEFYVEEIQEGLRDTFSLLYNSEAFKGSFVNVGIAMVTDLGIINEIDYLVSDLTIEGYKAFVEDFTPLLTRALNKLALEVDVTLIVSSMLRILEVVGVQLFNAFLNGKSYELFNWINVDNIKSIASGHYPELCAAHVRALDDDYVLNPFDEYDKMDGKYYVLTVTGDSDNIIVKNNGNTIVNTNPEKAISNGIAYIKKKKEYKIYLPYHEKYEVEVDKSSTILLSYFDTDIEEFVESVPSINSGIYSF